MTTPSNAPNKRYVAGMSEHELRTKYDVKTVVKMGSNESPLGPSPKAIEAIDEAKDRLHRYPPASDEALRTALAGHIGGGVTADHIATGNGGCELISLIAYAFLGKGTECIICRPTFPVYEFAARRSGAEIVYSDLKNGSFEYQPERIIENVGDRTRLVFLCSPNNPTGTLLTREEVEYIVGNLPEHVTVVLDEVYHHFISPGNKTDFVPYVISDRNMIVLHSFSKAYGLAGCRLGYVMGPPNLMESVRSQRNPFHLSEMAIAAGVAAIKDTLHLSSTIAVVQEGRKMLKDALHSLNVEVWPSEGNFLLFRTDKSGPAVVDLLLKQGVIIRPMDNFGMSDFLRVTVGKPAENERFIDSLSAALSDLSSS